MRVLVTNDDGVEAPGLVALAECIAAAGHDVVVVAPSGERSGSAAAIGRLHRSGPIACTEVRWPTLPDVPVFAIDAPPAATVYAGTFGAFGPRPDAVASGVNPGHNYGHLVLHSGTVGAALTAHALGLPAVAVSIGWSEQPHWTTGGTVAAPILGWLVDQGGPARVANVNVPDAPLEELRGVRTARLMGFAESWKAEAHPGELHLEYIGRSHEPEAGTDVAVVHDGYVAVTLLDGIVGREASALTTAVETVLAGYVRS